jgi:TRAP-type C4-dicarboxylate transport system substrate-binding protein
MYFSNDNFYKMPGNSVLKKQVKKFVENASEKDLKLTYNLFEINKQEDWWNELSKDHQKQIKDAIDEADRGRVIPHTEMAKRYRKWLKK